MDINLGFVFTLPNDEMILKTLEFLLYFSLAVLGITLVCRLLLKKEVYPFVKFGFTSALGVLMLYAMCVVLVVFLPRDFSAYFNSLPAGIFQTSPAGEHTFVIHSLKNLSAEEFTEHMLRIYILCVTINLLAEVNFDKPTLWGWLFARVAMLGVSLLLNFGILKAIGLFAPFLLEDNWPLVILSILCFCFVLGLLKGAAGAMSGAPNPAFGGFYDFFLKKLVGKGLFRGMFSAIVVCLLMWVFMALGYGTLPLNRDALNAYVPFAGVIFVLWCFVGRIL